MSPNADQKQSLLPERVDLSVSNIGGIDDTTVTLSAGVTVLSGRNATNRTSLLQGLMAALGSEQATLKADETTGRATLEADETYTAALERRQNTVRYGGEPFLDDPELADLFAFLLESNEARRAVARGADLRELIMRPVDTAAINDEITRLESEKRDLDDRLSELETLERRLPDLEQTRHRLEEEAEELRTELAELRDRLDTAEFDPAEGEDREARLREKLDAVQDARSELERVRDRIETERESIEALREERKSLREQLDELTADTETDLSQLSAEIDRLRSQKSDLDDEIAQLRQTIQFNQRRLDGSDPVFSDAGDLTRQLLSEGGEVTCWTCGSTVHSDRIEQTVDQLRELRQAKVAERSDIEADLEELRARKERIESDRRERSELTDRLDAVEAEIDRREDRKADLETRRTELSDRLETLETAVDRLDPADHEYLADVQKRVSELSVELEETERQLADTETEIDRIQRRIDDRERLRERREEVADRLTELRTRIDRLEAEAVEQFNTHMATLLELLGYENIERIWIKRLDPEEQPRPSFELRIVRTTEDGTAYQDSIDHLSESEREVTGLVFALAGYLVHDLHESVPVMVLDSLEAIDSERIATLVEYFREFVQYLVVALLEEDAQALADDHDVVSEI
ncbi:chromosome segregation protein SMC [Halovenus sp. WSH3]|uniref:Chromosome segregation protein SMC n=1 Tax=Halovenus carboxidivorans TaxID=2692199 RepID=A0A6B0T6U9_9EURY|nr:archaea-specific SMC-related protein [Halovenus carboxidivorans]MXR51926.1 chromosome segregation protein SMC [Halovenus carboxidivorans]